MRSRRLFALLTSIAMLHLSVAGGNAACAPRGHETHDPAPMNHRPADAGSTHLTGHATELAAGTGKGLAIAVGGSRADVPPCEVPAQQHCCEALAGCSMTVLVTSEPVPLATGVMPNGQVPEALDDAPASFASAPEPPPPKA